MDHLVFTLILVIVTLVVAAAIYYIKLRAKITGLEKIVKSNISADKYLAKIKSESEKIIAEREAQLTSIKDKIEELQLSAKQEAIKIKQKMADLQASAKQEALIDLQKITQEKSAAIEKADSAIKLKQQELLSLESYCNRLKLEVDHFKNQVTNLSKELKSYEEVHEIIECGLYIPHFDFDTSEKYKAELLRIRESQKELIRTEKATNSKISWTINGSEAAGKRQTKQYIRLMLRAFNGECEGFMADIRWNNINRVKDRLDRSFQTINKLGETHQVTITTEYFDLKLSELYLNYEYRNKLQREKEEHQRIQEQIREEQRSQKEIDKALKESEDDEKRFLKALEQARKEMEKVQGIELEQVKNRMQQLELELAEARKQKDRALSMAQQTKAGHVYVVSNIGSFGENIYKIGMTRRLDPMDRVRELGGASVPFEFDVHAMAFSEDAPALENLLHRIFQKNRVNMVNDRKEFFEVSIDEIESATKKFNPDIEFIRTPEAKDYRETLIIKKDLKLKNSN